jgi:hypothetical protein
MRLESRQYWARGDQLVPAPGLGCLLPSIYLRLKILGLSLVDDGPAIVNIDISIVGVAFTAMHLEGTPSDELPQVLATGSTDVRLAFISLSAREPQGRDAEYLTWHSLDHRPEQYRLSGLRNSLRLVSTPACRAARAASSERFDAVDHVMTYLFSDSAALPLFSELGGALHEGGRMPLRLPTVEFMTANLTGKVAAPHAVAGADVIPWRPAKGVYLIIETGDVPADSLAEVPGVAGVWWYHGELAPAPYSTDSRGMQITYCYLDDDPVATAERLAVHLRQRWASSDAVGLLAAPFHTLVPFDWSRYLPGNGDVG